MASVRGALKANCSCAVLLGEAVEGVQKVPKRLSCGEGRKVLRSGGFFSRGTWLVRRAGHQRLRRGLRALQRLAGSGDDVLAWLGGSRPRPLRKLGGTWKPLRGS